NRHSGFAGQAPSRGDLWAGLTGKLAMAGRPAATNVRPMHTAARKFLIVTADDFGLHPAVNAAVSQAAQTGVLTAASLMIAAPAAAEAIRVARELPRLRV